MRMDTQLRVCAYLLSLLGLWSVTITDHFSPVWALLATIMVLASWFYEGPRRYEVAYRRAWTILAICMIAYFPVDMMLLSDNLLLPAVHVAMFAQAYLLFNPKNMQSYRRLFIVSFAQMLASTNLTSDLVFAIILVIYCAIGVYGIMLMHLLSGLEGDGGEETKRNAPPSLLVSSLLFTAVLLPLTLTFFFTAPRLRYALVANSRDIEAQKRLQQARARTGFTATVQFGSFGRIQEDQTLALRVEFPEGSESYTHVRRWRGGALNIYDGTTWSSSRDFFFYYTGKKRDSGYRNAGTIYPRKNDLFIMDERYAYYNATAQLDSDARLYGYTCYLEVPFSDNIFGARDIKAAQGPFKYGLAQDFNRSFSISNRPGLPEFISYTAYSEIFEPDQATLRGVSREQYTRFFENETSGEYFRVHFLQIPTSLDPRIRSLAADITKDAMTPYDEVVAIKDYLENEYTYSLDLGIPFKDDPLAHFLFTSKSGHCEYFATAMTIMTRSIGIPARLVKGFQKGEWNHDGRYYEVRQRDAHAWVEVFFLNHGWVEFDASPRAVADAYFERRRSAIARAFNKRFLSLQILWRKHIVGYNDMRQTRLFSKIKNILRDSPKRLADLMGKLVGSAALASYLLGGVVAAGLLVAAYFGGRKLKLLPSLSWPAPRRGKSGYGTAFYERMLSALEKKKIVKPLYMTPLEFLEQPPLREHPMFSDIQAVTAIYNRVRFGGHPLLSKENNLINDILKRLRRSQNRGI